MIQIPDCHFRKRQLYAQHLAEMIRCPTITAVDDSSLDAFFALHAVMEKNFPLVHEKLEKKIIHKASLLYRWKGMKNDLAPVLLLAHQDVVEAPGDWEQPPFAGKIAGDRIWGRGALDNKGNLCAIFEAVESLLAAGFVPPADVYIASGNDEEQMGDGAVHILEFLRRNNIKLAMVLDEGPAVLEKMAGGITKSAALVGVVEKGFLSVRFTARSRGGHASTPPAITPIGQLSSFVCSMESKPPFRPVLNSVVRAMFKTLASELRFPLRQVFRNPWLLAPFLPILFSRLDSSTRSLVTTTCAFTMSSGSDSPNVLPAIASVTANLRLAIGDSVAGVMTVLQGRARKFGLECDILYAHEPTGISRYNGSAWEVLHKSINTCFPDAIIAPTVMPAATDSRHFSAICDHVYRFSPVLMTWDMRQSIHGLNESIAINDLALAVYFYENLLRNLK